MPASEFNTKVFVEYGRYFLLDTGADFTSTGYDGTGLTESGNPGVAGGACGTHTDWIRFDVQWHDQEPPVDLDGWEEIAETSFECASATIKVGSAFDWPLTLNAAFGPGMYRLRIHARGRDGGADSQVEQDEEFEDISVEHHMIALWRAEAAPPILHKATDRYGAYRRGSET